MNPQYLQQQNSYIGAQQSNSTYGEPNANFPQKPPMDSQNSLGMPPPSSNAPTAKSPLEHNPLHGPPFLQNQNNLIDQMSNVSLSGPPKPVSILSTVLFITSHHFYIN